MAGEATQTTVILQSRLTATAGITSNDVPGAHGWGKFQYSERPDFSDFKETGWIEAVPDQDFILRRQVTDLQPGRTYVYRLVYGAERSKTETGPTRRFKTLPAPDQSAPVRFVVGNCMNYAFYYDRDKREKLGVTRDEQDLKLGYPAMESIRKLQPDFFVGAGDNVYYDHPVNRAARTLAEMRRKWHEQFVLPRLVGMAGETATYWMKDDHDYRYNDADPTGNSEPSHEMGVRTFREQMPVVPAIDATNTTYRTLRCGRWLQIWMVEGRDYRSPNKSPDGPQKTIWGAEQKAWLRHTLLASDAPFKIMITPTPMVGPDDAYKRDNHTSPEGFRYEGEEFLTWVKAQGIRNFYTITGDRHWHYHSIHPTGHEEFACGALNTENSRLGRNPGDRQSTDPEAKVTQRYTDASPTGGYIVVEILPARNGTSAQLRFSIHNEWGKVLYQSTR